MALTTARLWVWFAENAWTDLNAMSLWFCVIQYKWNAASEWPETLLLSWISAALLLFSWLCARISFVHLIWTCDSLFLRRWAVQKQQRWDHSVPESHQGFLRSSCLIGCLVESGRCHYCSRLCRTFLTCIKQRSLFDWLTHLSFTHLEHLPSIWFG